MKDKFGPWLVALAALLWAVDAPFRKYLTDSLSSSTIVLMEHLVIAVLVIIFLSRYLVELRLLNRKESLSVLFIAWGGSALATIFFTQSFHYVNPSVSILLQKVQPFIAILMAWLILKEELNRKFWIFACVGIFGAYLVTFPELKVSGLTLGGGMLGVVFALLAAFFWGGSTVFGRLVLNKITFKAMTAARFLGALILLLAIEIFTGRYGEIFKAEAKDWFYVFIIAVLAGFLSLFIYYYGLRSTRASVATIAELIFPFAAVVINWYFLGAALSPAQILGGVLLVASIFFLSKDNKNSIKEPEQTLPELRKAVEQSEHRS